MTENLRSAFSSEVDSSAPCDFVSLLHCLDLFCRLPCPCVCARMCEDLVVGNKLKIRIPFIVGVQQCVCVAVCAEYQRICDDSCLQYTV